MGHLGYRSPTGLGSVHNKQGPVCHLGLDLPRSRSLTSVWVQTFFGDIKDNASGGLGMWTRKGVASRGRIISLPSLQTVTAPP